MSNTTPTNAVVTGLEHVGSGIATGLHFVEHFFEAAVQDEKILAKMTPEAKAIAVKIFTDLTVLVADGTITVADKGSNLAIDAKVIADIQSLYLDAKSGVSTAKAMFEALNINLTVTP